MRKITIILLAIFLTGCGPSLKEFVAKDKEDYRCINECEKMYFQCLQAVNGFSLGGFGKMHVINKCKQRRNNCISRMCELRTID